MRRLLLIVTVFAALAAPAAANVISFETAPSGPGFAGPVIEDGFSYENGSGGLYINSLCNPGRDLEGDQISGGGVVVVRRADGGKFRFDSIDFAAFNRSGTGTQDLIIAGVAGGFLQFDVYTAFNTADAPYTNWTTEYADVLHNKLLDEMYVIVGGGSEPTSFTSAIDNLVLTPSVPEPASLALLAAGLLVFGARRRI